VGQADATLLLGPDFTVLIDAGDYRRNDVVPHLKSIGVKELDLLIGTHPHADHIGQFPQVLETFPVKEVWLSGDTHTTRTFERTIDAILASGAAYHEPRAGEIFQFGSLHIEVLNPSRLTGNFHEGSVSIRAAFGNVAFIFTGDAETNTERTMIARGNNLRAQILQLGHHGSRTSSSQNFLEAVQPGVAIYSAGEGNSYGHPHDEVVDRILSMGIQLYGTDVHGTIVVESDGTTYSVSTDKAGDIRGPPSVAHPEPANFVLSNLSVSPSEIIVGESITISVDVANSGGNIGTHAVTLKVNGSELATQSLTLDPGQSQRVTFTTKTESGGTYTVEVDGLKSSFTAIERAVTGNLAVSASVKFASLGGGTQTLYATVTLNGRPVQGA